MLYREGCDQNVKNLAPVWKNVRKINISVYLLHDYLKEMKEEAVSKLTSHVF